MIDKNLKSGCGIEEMFFYIMILHPFCSQFNIIGIIFNYSALFLLINRHQRTVSNMGLV